MAISHMLTQIGEICLNFKIQYCQNWGVNKILTLWIQFYKQDYQENPCKDLQAKTCSPKAQQITLISTL